MSDIMLDLETLGVRPGYVVLSIGATTFSRDQKDHGAEFHVIIDIFTSKSAGLKVDSVTESWWEAQSYDAKKTLNAAYNSALSVPLGEALVEFSDWLRKAEPDIVKRRIWGNGANFDPPILEAAYRMAGLLVPWHTARNVRCYRTLKNLRPSIKLEARSGTHHNALDDAVTQASHARNILNEIGGWEE